MEEENKRKELFRYLEETVGGSAQDWEVNKTHSHPPAFTVDEWRSHADKLFPDAKMCKNLFMKEKKKNSIWLVVALEDTPVDLKKLTKYLGFSSGSLRFAPEDVLESTLKVKQGSVTPLGLVNDRTEKKVNVMIDSKMVEDPEKNLLFHPLSNDFSTVMKGSELEKFLKATGHSVEYKDFSTLE
eukprot:TRINITY_DN1257_c0_g1_i3.p1 TRINITY_DN1257_c0_g1~~TRINITY_DN1257_c0_g1_i3.p1  ORF type:complete len:184 (-),score=65.40 TRINITY_DN1257_c0_g1_i3:873-1424(-)